MFYGLFLCKVAFCLVKAFSLIVFRPQLTFNCPFCTANSHLQIFNSFIMYFCQPHVCDLHKYYDAYFLMLSI